MTETAEEKPSLLDAFTREAREWLTTLAWAVPVYLAFTTVAFASYNIPSESMVPTLQVGDRILVNKFAYGYSRDSLPFNVGRLILPDVNKRVLGRLPNRGDVVVFRHPSVDQMAPTGLIYMDSTGKYDDVLVKRLIGLPGDV